MTVRLHSQSVLMQLTDFKVLTFDCYGTLIDWETGLQAALSSLIGKAEDRHIGPDEALQAFARHESAQQAETPAMLYAELLSVVYVRLAEEWNVQITTEQAFAFGASIADWPAFSDSVAALQYLEKFYRLVILSNVDRKSFRASSVRLGVEFDAVYSAQDIGSYKPDLRNFEYMLRRLKDDFDLEPSDVLHTAQSLFHDHVPANQIGLASAWIDRRHAVPGAGATNRVAETPHYDFRFESLGAMVTAHEAALRDA